MKQGAPISPTLSAVRRKVVDVKRHIFTVDIDLKDKIYRLSYRDQFLKRATKKLLL